LLLTNAKRVCRRCARAKIASSSPRDGSWLWEWDILTDATRGDARIFRIFGAPTEDGVID